MTIKNKTITLSCTQCSSPVVTQRFNSSGEEIKSVKCWMCISDIIDDNHEKLNADGRINQENIKDTIKNIKQAKTGKRPVIYREILDKLDKEFTTQEARDAWYKVRFDNGEKELQFLTKTKKSAMVASFLSRMVRKKHIVKVKDKKATYIKTNRRTKKVGRPQVKK